MIILLGDATKKAGEFLKLDKWYEATIRLGASSTTGDPEGEITECQNKIAPSEGMITDALAEFTGEIIQRPPVFSAIKINGQRAYKLARDGKEVEIPERTVTIYELELVEYSYPYLKIRTHVSSGTYIRSLAVDLGKALRTEAYCTELRRTRVAAWHIDQAKVLDGLSIER